MWLVHAWYFLRHLLGIDTQASMTYDFWSGFGAAFATQITLIASALAIFRHINCHQKGCWRRGKYELKNPEAGVTYRLCWKHHPGIETKHPHEQHFHELWERMRAHDTST